MIKKSNCKFFLLLLFYNEKARVKRGTIQQKE